MKKKWYKQPTLVLGLAFIIIVLVASFIHSIFFDTYVAKTEYFYNEQNKLVGPPLAPFDHSIFGTDLNGNHLVYYILQGAKFTILGALSIALVSFVLAMLIGIPLGFRYKGKTRFVENSISFLYFIPASLIAYIFLRPLLIEPMGGFPTSLSYRISVEVLVIGILLAMPAAILLANETSVLLKKEFVISSRVLGGRPYHIFRHHLIPHMKGTMLTLLTTLTIQAILVMTHLGVFELYFGGTNIAYGGSDPPLPITYDWASLIGMYYYTLQTTVHWLIGIPLIFLVLFILSLIGIEYGIKKCITID
ncbi:ABC transporter permease subunit [Radiobacillus deserti]|uniref:ABC transporter permease subunit n=1 Tax=Radiobacillus deserti TaxID=2594883 RepID=A0A516KHV7_9BACI|nr:ABC transporter permease subunit [Radiobacillus deserti]QDP40980.1 ABC transporter permease subunit [Radiobacillus deserti]